MNKTHCHSRPFKQYVTLFLTFSYTTGPIPFILKRLFFLTGGLLTVECKYEEMHFPKALKLELKDKKFMRRFVDPV